MSQMMVRRVKDTVQGWLGRRGIILRRKLPSLIERPESELFPTIEQLVARRMMEQEHDQFFVLQIGAFDGHTGDPIHDLVQRYRWRGLLVEPQRRYFEALQATYCDRPDLVLMNVAIGDRREVRPLYRVRDESMHLSEWAPQVASFYREHLLREGYADEDIDFDQVQTITMTELLDEVPVTQIDLLQIDVEGYDYEILRPFEFDRFKPVIVRFESKHLSRHDHDAAVRLLIHEGYHIGLERAGDTSAYLVNG
jgi:FkbM family methyltransferase